MENSILSLKLTSPQKYHRISKVPLNKTHTYGNKLNDKPDISSLTYCMGNKYPNMGVSFPFIKRNTIVGIFIR
jgi:hypothetical protein